MPPIETLWKSQNNETGLFGAEIDIQTGEWISNVSGLGAGMDSFYEYLLKSHILFGLKSDLDKFEKVYSNLKFYLRKGRPLCNEGQGPHPFYVNVDLR